MIGWLASPPSLLLTRYRHLYASEAAMGYDRLENGVQKRNRIPSERRLSGSKRAGIGRESFKLRRQECSCPSVPRRGPSCQVRDFDFSMGYSFITPGSDLLIHPSPSGVCSSQTNFRRWIVAMFYEKDQRVSTEQSHLASLVSSRLWH